MSELPAADAQVITYHMNADGGIERVDKPHQLDEDAPVTIRVVDANGVVIRETSSGTTTMREGRRALAENRAASGGRFSPDVADKLLQFKKKRPEAYQALVRKLGFPPFTALPSSS